MLHSPMGKLCPLSKLVSSILESRRRDAEHERCGPLPPASGRALLPAHQTGRGTVPAVERGPGRSHGTGLSGQSRGTSALKRFLPDCLPAGPVAKPRALSLWSEGGFSLPPIQQGLLSCGDSWRDSTSNFSARCRCKNLTGGRTFVSPCKGSSHKYSISCK